MSSNILLCSCKACPILLIDYRLGTINLLSLNAFGSKKKLTLSEDYKKYLLSLCYELPVLASKMVIFSGLGSKISTRRSIS
jgi:hypothetical protein